ncbi:DUF658 family protein [Lactococcus petauri]|uniref:DUF658 family protein n=1 Tax=Lactococcus petauri TaxID=1940789 RepID=UPI0038542C37
MKKIVVRQTKLAVLEIIQGGKVLFKGNTNEIKEHYGVNQNKINQWRGKGYAVEKGSIPRPTTIYAKCVGHVYGSVSQEVNVTNAYLEEMEEEKLRETETKEERRLRRNIRAQMAIEAARKEELGL